MAQNGAMNEFSAPRKPSYQAQGGYHVPYGHAASQAQTLRNAQYMTSGNPMMHQGHGDGVAAMTHAFGGLSFQTNPHGTNGRGNSLVAAAPEYPGAVQMTGPAMYLPPGQQMMFGTHLLPGSGSSGSGSSVYNHVAPYLHSPYDTKFMQSSNGSENYPPSSWTSRVPSDNSHVPTLITPRRGSMSSNEEHFPATPYHTYNGYAGGVSIMDRSPSAVCTNNTTPSPSSYVPGYGGIAMTKPYQQPPISMGLQMLLQREPAIPRAIPAPSSPVKPLDRCLENKNGETNVYIRGLLPETTDEMLENWGVRFGDIQSSKSIIDHKTGLCKG
jgi:hypothetical protein